MFPGCGPFSFQIIQKSLIHGLNILNLIAKQRRLLLILNKSVQLSRQNPVLGQLRNDRFHLADIASFFHTGLQKL